MSQFLMPSLGADMESAILMEWLVKKGDKVTKGQVIAEIETSKGVIEIEVFEDGIIEELLVEEETECIVGTPLAIINSDSKETKNTKKETEKNTDIKEEVSKNNEIIEEVVETKNIQIDKEQKERLKVSPAARKKADELGIDLSKITTKDGEIHLAQIESSLSFNSDVPTKKEVKTVEEKIDKKDSMRQAIAAAMSLSNAEIPHYYLETSINMTPALNYLEELNKQRSVEDRILPVALLIRAVVLALQDVPQLNGFWIDNSHQISEDIHPGIAIALRKGGLMTPALLDAKRLNLSETMENLGDLISRTRGGKLRSSEMTKQTITITNLGDLGVQSVFGVIYPPQLAVVGLGAIIDFPWAQDDTLCVRKVMKATIAGDHRATDGRVGASFLDKLNKYLQNPKELL